jgi:hypothetical protein
MDASGHVVLGEPGSSERKSDSVFGMRATATKAKPRAAKDEPMDLAGNLKEAWTGLPKAVRAVLIVVAAAAAIWAFVPMPRLGSPPLPAELAGRVQYVANAFIDESTSQLRKVAAPGTEADAAAWLQTVRPLFKHSGPRRQGNIVTILPPMSLDEAPVGTQRILLNLQPPRPDPAVGKTEKARFAPGYKTDGTFALPTVWKATDDGKWLFDGTASLANAKNPPTPEEDPEPTYDPSKSRRYGSSRR